MMPLAENVCLSVVLPLEWQKNGDNGECRTGFAEMLSGIFGNKRLYIGRGAEKWQTLNTDYRFC